MSEFISSSTQVKRMAKALTIACNIPDGDNVVILIGTGQESSNLKALEYWVSEQLEPEQSEISLTVLEQLKLKLQVQLESWQYR